MVTAAATAARSIFRSASARSAAAKIVSGSKSARSPFRAPATGPLSQRIFRCPAELSACLETMQPFHTATASALMTSMLSVSCRSYGWVPDGVFHQNNIHIFLRTIILCLDLVSNHILEFLDVFSSLRTFWAVMTFELMKGEAARFTFVVFKS
ncbi:hypothetical protein Cgig2_002948 [Carnegiea gigantea]|uniref:Protein NUCLEAR FUSION DEFECTIVE 6, chloroplastic/mitochondrial-like n=1 Tax=Carnegiea gigantea TaxID=171969 RepID=A0A9Q1Q6Y9_9CARY|nr:hypothetical protein Cgig2_002948 [Carnegiea gigantea]